MFIYLKRFINFIYDCYYNKYKYDKFIFSHLYDINIQQNRFVDRKTTKKLVIKKHSYLLPDIIDDIAKESLKFSAEGNSDVSEMFSIQFMINEYEGTKFIFEKQVQYWVDYKMVDYIFTKKKKRVGVSVTRAMGFPNAEDFTEDDAIFLLNKKIKGLIIARNSVIEIQTFYECILHVWCQNEKIGDMISKNFGKMCFDMDGSLSLIATVCDDKRIYENKFDLL